MKAYYDFGLEMLALVAGQWGRWVYGVAVVLLLSPVVLFLRVLIRIVRRIAGRKK